MVEVKHDDELSADEAKQGESSSSLSSAMSGTMGDGSGRVRQQGLERLKRVIFESMDCPVV